MIVKLLFFYFSLMIIASAVFTITRRNVVHSVLSMLFMFFHVAGIYLLLNAEFMAAIQIIVYAGAILVLFLFVIMLLNIKQETRENPYIHDWPLGLSLAFCLGFGFFGFIAYFERTGLGQSGAWSIDRIKDMTHTLAIGKLLYTKYLFPFEVTSLILLVALIGAVVLTKKRL